MNVLSNAKRSVSIAFIGIRSWLSNKRMLMLLLILAAVIADFCFEVNSYAGSIGAPTNIFAILPQMYYGPFIRMNIQLGIVLMFSDAPFHREDSLYCVTRCGYRSWCVGQLLYILFSSAAYAVTLFLLTMIFSIPALGFSLEWGRTFTGLARRTSRGGHSVSAPMQEQFSAFGAFLNTLALIFILSVIIGLLIFLLSSTVGKGSGVIAAAAVILLGVYPGYTQYVGPVIKISPCSLTELRYLRGIMGLPDTAYAFTFLGITAAILTAANIFIYSNRRIRHYAYNTDI